MTVREIIGWVAWIIAVVFVVLGATGVYLVNFWLLTGLILIAVAAWSAPIRRV